VPFEQFAQAGRAELKRRMVVMPPCCSKREMRSIQFASWVMGH
jgi:hypothetical protein